MYKNLKSILKMIGLKNNYIAKKNKTISVVSAECVLNVSCFQSSSTNEVLEKDLIMVWLYFVVKEK